MNIQQEPLLWLQEWYKDRFDGQWEHSYGISIDTIDNPGWKLSIDLKGTLLEEFFIEVTSIERSEYDWVHYKVVDNKFISYGGPNNLSELIMIFRNLYTRK